MKTNQHDTEDNRSHQDAVIAQTNALPQETTSAPAQMIRFRTRGYLPAPQPSQFFHPVKIPRGIKGAERSMHPEVSSGCTIL